MAQPFARFHAIMAIISASMAAGTGMPNVNYKSRGKGRGTPSRVWIKKPGKYIPHSGAKENAKSALRIAKGVGINV